MVRNARKTLVEQKQESKKSDPYKVIVVSEAGDGPHAPTSKNQEYFRTARRVLEECKKQKIECYILSIDGAYFKSIENVHRVHNKDDPKGFVVDTNTIVIVRGPAFMRLSWLDLISQLERTGATMVNSRDTLAVCSDKYRAAIRLERDGLTQPKTALIPNESGVKLAVENLDVDFPVVLKTLEGSKGVGVVFIESARSLDAIVQLLFKQDPEADLLLQQYIKTNFDVRVIVLNDTVMAAMSREVLEGDFRSNFSQGAKVKEYKLTALEIEQSLLAAKAVSGVWTAVDFIPSQKPKKEPPYILEVNHSPGTEGIETATGRNIIKELLDYFQNPKNRHPVALEVGRFERLEILGVGKIVANFDTGNSARAIMHCDEWEVKDKKVIWKNNGKTFKHDLVKMRTYEQGKWSWSSKTPIERPSIHLDIDFNGRVYKDVQFIVDDRSHKVTKCLMNQTFMRRANVMVNPAKTFVVSTKHGVEPDGTFKKGAFDLF
jgi:ribosomal protein S6--L-glutamate ligase